MRLAIELNDVIRDYTSAFKTYYKKSVDPYFDIEDDKITSLEYDEVFPFKSTDDYMKFRFIDYPFELNGRAEAMGKMLPYKLTYWLQNGLRDMDEEYVPDVLFVGMNESPLTIQATYFFLSKIQSRVRQVFFPTSYDELWDKCDMLITANPHLIENAPEDKIVIKIEAPYNKEIACKYSFKSLSELIDDKNETVIKILCGEEIEENKTENTETKTDGE